MIVVAGESLIDRVIRPDGSASEHVGGGPFNSARTIGRLGRPVRLITAIGDDDRGHMLLAGLTESGVDVSGVVVRDLPTTLALATLNENNAASYVFDFETSAGRHVTHVELGADATFLHVGTLALVLEPFATAVEEAIGALDPRVALLVDPNCRPSVVRDPEHFLTHVRAAVARADVVKLSDDDLDYLRSLDATFPGTSELLAAGTSCVLFTRGGDGVEVSGPWGSQVVPAPSVEVVDTVGAGDSLSGGFVAWWDAQGLSRSDLSNRDHVIAATTYAVRVAAMTVARAGANPPTAAELAVFEG